MSIIDIKPTSIPAELRVKIEHVMKERNLSWRDAIVFLAREMVSPSKAFRRNRAFLRT